MPPAWPPRIAASPATTDYAYLCVDGGLMYNEPLELARRILAGPAGRNPRSGRAATRAILMIDPFPNVAPFSEDYAPKDDILAVFKGMFGALKNQARFKPDELVLAAEEDVYSCFMIAPRRKLADGSPSAFPMASNALGGFGGFLTEAFREHDFQLGRRNGQRFLQRHFCLPAAGADRNPLFDQWSATARSHHQFTEDGVTFLPIVPLIDGAATPIPSPAWPAFGEADLESLRGRVAKRVELVTGRLTDQYVKNWAARTLVRGVLLMKRGSLVDDIMETIRKSLADTGLLAGTVAPRARIDDFITVPHE